MKWLFLSPVWTEATTHTPPYVVCPEEMAPKLIETWAADKARYAGREDVVFAEVKQESSESFLLDIGGMMWAGRHEYKFDLQGLQIVVPATDVDVFSGVIENMLNNEPSERFKDGEPLYAVKSFRRTLVLPRAVLEELRTALRDRAPEASAIAAAENARLNEVVDGSKFLHKGLKRGPGPTKEA